jgi:hypothetical protein
VKSLVYKGNTKNEDSLLQRVLDTAQQTQNTLDSPERDNSHCHSALHSVVLLMEHSFKMSR